MSTLKITNLQNASAASPAIVLDANSRATLNGLSYPTEGSLSGRNRIINGDMRIDQRNAGASASLTASQTYFLDRWFAVEDTDGTMTIQQSTTAPAGFQRSALLTTGTADTSLSAAQYAYIGHKPEGFNVADFDWGTANAKTVTLSFWVRSSLTGTFGGAVSNSAYNRSYPFTYTISAANTFEYKSITIPGDTTGTWVTDNGIGMQIFWGLGVGSTNSGTAGSWAASGYISATGATSVIGTASATFYITGVQLEAGSVATPFERRTLTQEQLLCSRYYHTNVEIGTLPNKGGGTYFDGVIATVVNAGTSQATMYRFPVPMRVAPTITVWTPNNGTQGQAWSETTQANVSYSINAGSKQFYSGSNPTSAGISGNAYYFHYAASAEL